MTTQATTRRRLLNKSHRTAARKERSLRRQLLFASTDAARAYSDLHISRWHFRNTRDVALANVTRAAGTIDDLLAADMITWEQRGRAHAWLCAIGA